MTEMTWGFPLFLHSNTDSNVFFKFTPRSDFGVVYREYLCPLVISETISQKKESDRWRMLLQAIAAARAGHFLMRRGTEKHFFVVAIYLRATLEAERYIVMQTSAGPSNPVSIIQNSFDLKDAKDSTDFLLEMFNLTKIHPELMQELDHVKKKILGTIKRDAQGLSSLSTAPRTSKKTTSKMTLSSIAEGTVDQAVDDHGVFAAEDIQEILHTIGYKITFRVFAHPNLARIDRVGYSRHGYLKFVEQGRNEAKILEYLSSFTSLSNHTIQGTQIWHVRNGTVIFMPPAGSWLTSLTNPSDKLWFVAKQLFMGVDFMHAHGVAHLDIKPGNLLIPKEGGQLSIIDYGRAVRFTGKNDVFRGTVGTPEYMAPEVAAGSGLWSAVRADLWSVGKSLEELCMLCGTSAQGREPLLAIARQLMSNNPTDRPSTSQVLQWMAEFGLPPSTDQGTFS
ncbi:kinase-like domain-containing protein [Scleroderma citrinum]